MREERGRQTLEITGARQATDSLVFSVDRGDRNRETTTERRFDV